MNDENINAFVNHGPKQVNTDWALIPAVVSAIISYIALIISHPLVLIVVISVWNVLVFLFYFVFKSRVEKSDNKRFLFAGVYWSNMCLSIAFLGCIGIMYLNHILLATVITVILLATVLTVLVTMLTTKSFIKHGKYLTSSNSNKTGELVVKSGAILGVVIVFVIAKSSFNLRMVVGGITLSMLWIFFIVYSVQLFMKYFYSQKFGQ